MLQQRQESGSRGGDISGDARVVKVIERKQGCEGPPVFSCHSRSDAAAVTGVR